MLRNSPSSTPRRFHFNTSILSPCGERHWGPDQFTEALPPSRFFTVSSIQPGCYDVEFVVAPWNTCVIAGAALRRNEVWKVTQWTVFGSQSGDCSHVAGYVPAKRRPWTWQPTSGQPASASDIKRVEMAKVLVTGGAGFLARICASVSSSRATMCFASTTILPAAGLISRTSLAIPTSR